MIDFPDSEFRARLSRAQGLMAEAGVDALFLTTEAEVRYFTGFRTLFWQSPTRPWFVVVPQSGEITAVIPSIGAELMGRTWVKDIRTWPSPRGFDEGLNLLVDVMAGFTKIGVPMGEESSLRMSLTDFDTLRQRVSARFVDCSGIVKNLRMVKSKSEIDVLRKICAIGSDAFDQVPSLIEVGMSLSKVFSTFKIALIEAGAEEVPYLVGGAGAGGYGDVISPPDDTPLSTGDVLMLDTGSVLQGYFCDFDRNFSFGAPNEETAQTHRRLWDVTEAGMECATAGTRCSELFQAMNSGLGSTSSVGRLGHGLGMQLTEWPSIAPHDDTVLQEGMVMTLEPSMEMSGGRMMVVEENILITSGAPELLTKRVPREIVVI